MNNITGGDEDVREASLKVDFSFAHHGCSNVVVAVAMIIIADKDNLAE
jgi:hypothetical protein